MRRADVLGLALLLAGCGTADGPVAIHTAAQPILVCELARVSGTLVPDPTFGLALQNGADRRGATWPYGYTARRSSGVVELLDPSGRIIARAGDLIVAAGGATNSEFSVQCDIQVNPSPGT